MLKRGEGGNIKTPEKVTQHCMILYCLLSIDGIVSVNDMVSLCVCSSHFYT